VIYSLLRSTAGVALRWYYADVTFVGAERIPETGPILVAVNHPNALVDVLVAGRATPRQLSFTAKATLFANPVTALFLRWIGVLPLRRASDEAGKGPVDPSRNAESFAAVADALARSAAVLIFPEGKSHDEPALAPARTGAARMAIQAREARNVSGIRVVPIGLIFERKDRPRSRIVAITGEPIDVDPLVQRAADPVAELTAAIDTSLRSLTLNYSSMGEAERDARLARVLQAVLRADAPSLGGAGDFQTRAEIARLLPSLRTSFQSGQAQLHDRAVSLEASLLRFDDQLRAARVSPDDLLIERDTGPGLWFVLREASVLLVAGPIAAWGWVNHLIPFQGALLAGSRARQSAADPAMRTIIAGAAFILMMYMLQGAAVALVAGPWWGLAYVVSLPVAADVNLRLRDRLRRAGRRARAYLFFRSRPAVHEELTRQASALRAEAVTLANASGIADVR
jgi:glycerol-3-phosphate O-acyltransferase / dihydroxyacetone phosphate acyltransferase